jgi:hypothetical protein
MRITSGGNVGIGTLSPTNYSGYRTLSVNNTSGGVLELKVNDVSALNIFSDSIQSYLYEGRNLPLGFYTNSAERMRITSGGNVGIGTTSPNFTASGRTVLDINGASSSGLSLSSGGTSYGFLYVNSGTYIIGNQVANPITFEVNSTERMRITSGGAVVIANLGTGTVYSNAGALTSTNPSDERLKDDITDLQYGLNEILKLRPVSYNWKNDTANQGKQFGFIAQEVQEIMPELISEFTTTENEEEVVRLGLDKEGIYATLVNAIQEQQKQIEQLKSLINK